MLVTVWQGLSKMQMDYLIESNHDVEILRAGSYAWRLKQRILSDLGHFQRRWCRSYDSDAREIALRKFTLVTYLRRNNIKELAHMTMVNQLAQADLGVGVNLKGL